MRRILASLLLSAVVVSAPAAALEEKSLSTYSRETWTPRDGLPHNQVNGIAQTREGYLWFATWEGVVRYNGQEFRSFGRHNVPEIRDNGIRSVRVAPGGALVVATSRGGASVLRGEAWSTYGIAEGLAQDELATAIEDHAGRLWAATESRGITRLHDGVATHFGREQGLPSDDTFALLEDGAGAIWVGTGDGVARIVNDCTDGSAEGNILRCQIVEQLALGETSLCVLRPEGLPAEQVTLNLSTAQLRSLQARPGRWLRLAIAPEAVHIMPQRERRKSAQAM